MKLIDRAKAYFRPAMSAQSTLPSPETPKVQAKQQLIPSYAKTAKPNTETPLQRSERNLANTDLLSYRAGLSSAQTIRDFSRASPDLSAAVQAYVRVGITSGYTAIARNLDGTVMPEATSALAQVLTRLSAINDYTLGFDDAPSLRTISEIWARELITNGAIHGELVLDKARMPYKVQPVSDSQIRLFPSSDNKRLLPKQFIAGNYIDLNIPTFFTVALDPDLLEAYPISPIEPAIQPVLFSASFLNDVRRVVRKAIHPRVTVTIDSEKFMASLGPDTKQNQEKLDEYREQVLSDLEKQVNGLEPDDALVVFSEIGVDVADHGNTNLSNEYAFIGDMANGKLAAGAKVLPTILGHSDGTSNTASAEVLLFMKSVEGSVWAKLNEMWSKVLTLGVRLLGYDIYVDFKYNAIDLRPEGELEAFKAMYQSRMLELCSLGFLSDEETAIRLTGSLPPAGFKPLSGTNFMQPVKATPAGDGNNGASNSGSTLNQNLNSSAPKNAKSKNGGQSGAEIIPIGG